MDRVTKATLMLIAAGLWANAAIMVVRPTRAAPLPPPSDETVIWLGRIANEIVSIETDFGLLIQW